MLAPSQPTRRHQLSGARLFASFLQSIFRQTSYPT